MKQDLIGTVLKNEVTDDVRWLISIQSFDGTWILTDDQVARLMNGKSLGNLKITGSFPRDTVTTALAIAVLDLKHADQKVLWATVVDKARKEIIQTGFSDRQIDDLVDEIKAQITK